MIVVAQREANAIPVSDDKIARYLAALPGNVLVDVWLVERYFGLIGYTQHDVSLSVDARLRGTLNFQFSLRRIRARRNIKIEFELLAAAVENCVDARIQAVVFHGGVIRARRCATALGRCPENSWFCFAIDLSR